MVHPLRKLRQVRGLTQTATARRARTSQAAVSQIERGVFRPSPGLARRLARAVGGTPEQITGDEGVIVRTAQLHLTERKP